MVRLAWILALSILGLSLGAMAARNLMGLYVLRADPELLATYFLPTAVWTGLYIVGAAACAFGIFRSPKDVLTRAEPEVEPAKWLKEMRDDDTRGDNA